MVDGGRKRSVFAVAWHRAEIAGTCHGSSPPSAAADLREGDVFMRQDDNAARVVHIGPDPLDASRVEFTVELLHPTTNTWRPVVAV